MLLPNSRVLLALLVLFVCTQVKRPFCLCKIDVLRRYFPFCGKLHVCNRFRPLTALYNGKLRLSCAFVCSVCGWGGIGGRPPTFEPYPARLRLCPFFIFFLIFFWLHFCMLGYTHDFALFLFCLIAFIYRLIFFLLGVLCCQATYFGVLWREYDK